MSRGKDDICQRSQLRSLEVSISDVGRVPGFGKCIQRNVTDQFTCLTAAGRVAVTG